MSIKSGKMEENSNKKKRGGCRAGAGRPKSDRKLIAFRADVDVLKALEKVENKTEYINDCIRYCLNTIKK